MKKLLLSLAAVGLAFSLVGCQSNPSVASPAADVVAASPDLQDLKGVLLKAAPAGYPEHQTVKAAKKLQKLLGEGAQYVLYSTDPPVTFELPAGPIQLEGASRAVVMRYVGLNHCVPLSNTTSVGNPLLTVCLEEGKSVLRTFEGMSYAALQQSMPEGARIAPPPPDMLELPQQAPGEADEGEGDTEEGVAQAQPVTILALPQEGTPLTGYPVSQYVVVESPKAWAADDALGAFTRDAGCRLVEALADSSAQFAVCYVDDELSILPETELEELANAEAPEEASATVPPPQAGSK